MLISKLGYLNNGSNLLQNDVNYIPDCFHLPRNNVPIYFPSLIIWRLLGKGLFIRPGAVSKKSVFFKLIKIILKLSLNLIGISLLLTFNSTFLFLLHSTSHLHTHDYELMYGRLNVCNNVITEVSKTFVVIPFCVLVKSSSRTCFHQRYFLCYCLFLRVK